MLRPIEIALDLVNTAQSKAQFSHVCTDVSREQSFKLVRSYYLLSHRDPPIGNP